MKIGIWLGIIISAFLSYAVAIFYEQPIHWYLLILLIVTGLFINTIIIILKLQDDPTEGESN
ncbi:hypothetical protein NYE67_02525 [Solibacillus sp. FSL W8-0474]|uniref:hypothetical protein n=1 Tax=Solibacillus sp. FSL W8-0474 TaxID=2975336 RepID=UPI0030FBAE2D